MLYGVSMTSDLEGLYSALLDRQYQPALFGDLEGFHSTAGGYIACCPFHAERTPTLLIHGSRPGYFCFVCGARGDWIDYLLRRKKDLSYGDAVGRLESEAGIRISTGEVLWRSELLLSETLEAMQGRAVAELWSEIGLEARSYLGLRGYTQEEIEGMELGLAPAAQSLHESADAVLSPPIREAVLEALRASYGTQPVLTIPCRDAAGRLMGLYGRDIRGAGERAYRPLTDMTRLRHVPFLMHRARGYARIVVVQGFLDALLADRIGITGVVGVGRSGLTPDLLATTVRYGARKFLLSLDTVQATFQAIDRIEAAGCEAEVVDRPERYPDTDAYIRDNCINKFGKLLEKTIPAKEWLSRNHESSL